MQIFQPEGGYLPFENEAYEKEFIICILISYTNKLHHENKCYTVSLHKSCRPLNLTRHNCLIITFAQSIPDLLFQIFF
jgi:hypothetical protein